MSSFKKEWISSHEQVVNACLPRVRRIARQVSARLPRPVDLEDLYQEGMLGLLDAMEKYQPDMQASFFTYAEYRIRGAILDSVRRDRWEPRRETERRRRIAQTLAEKASGGSSSGTRSHGLGDSGSEPAAEQPRLRLVRFSEMTGGEPGDREQPSFPANEPTATEMLVEEEKHRCLWDTVKRLPERERAVIELHYRNELGLAEVAERFGIRPARASQLHQRALGRLRLLCLRSRILEGAREQLG